MKLHSLLAFTPDDPAHPIPWYHFNPIRLAIVRLQLSTYVLAPLRFLVRLIRPFTAAVV